MFALILTVLIRIHRGLLESLLRAVSKIGGNIPRRRE